MDVVQRLCPHTDEEQALVSTWVTLELEKPIEMGYVIMEKYWAWHFPHTTQYDPVTKMGGLWAECINLWTTRK